MQHQEARPPHSYPRHRTMELVLATTVACLMSISARRVLAQQSPANRLSTKAPPTQMTLRNVSRDTMRLELRVGVAPDCKSNPLVATQLLAPGKRWLVATPRPLCWRRVDAKASASAGAWHRHVLKAGEDVNVTLTN